MIRLASLWLLAAGLAACQPMGLERPSPASEERAERLSQRGDHAGAARVLETAAARAGTDRRAELWLAAAREWLAANDIAAVERALAQLQVEAGTMAGREATRLAAEVALARGQTARAVALLDPLAHVGDAAILATRAQVAFATGRTVEAVRILMDRQRLLDNPRARLANQRLIINGVARATELRTPAGADAELAGWLELGRITADASEGGAATQRRLRAWRTRYPAHPADPALWQSIEQQTASAAAALPRRVALLLPLSGRSEAAGAAVRDGFFAAYYDHPASQRPQVRIYDVARQDAPSAYLQALADGCDFVVGPLTREEVAALARLSDGRAAALALNFLPDGVRAPDRFYQFALSPEDEARLAAQRIVADGRLSGVMLVPQSDWGRRVAMAFAQELAAAGGQLVAEDSYATSATDFNEQLRRMLQTTGLKGSTPRVDAQFIFVGAQPLHGRLIRTQLQFIYASALPMYATSDVFDTSGRGNQDLNGVIFPDMPWVLASGGAVAEAREAFASAYPAPMATRNRLHAFGHDAFRLMSELRQPNRGDTVIPGMTGKLSLSHDGRVHRELSWAVMSEGRPSPWPAPPAP